MESDPTIWVAKGLKARLENAGYHVSEVLTGKPISTPIIVTVVVESVFAQNAEPTDYQKRGFFRIATKFACVATLNVSFELKEDQKLLLYKSFEGKHEQPTGYDGCGQRPALKLALRKALENLLDHAVPPLLSALRDASGGATQHKRQDQQ